MSSFEVWSESHRVPVSPGFARAPAGSSVSPELVFDAVRDAILVVDAASTQLRVVMANLVARRFLMGTATARNPALDDASLYHLLGSDTDAAVEAALTAHAGGAHGVTRLLAWRSSRGEALISTELKLLPTSVGQRHLMLTFAEPDVMPDMGPVAEQLPLDLLILDKQLTVTYANSSAARTAGAPSDGILSFSGLTVVPTAAIPREAFVQALSGVHYQDNALEVTTPGEPTRWFEVDMQPLKDASGIAGVAVLSMEISEQRLRHRPPNESESRLSALTEHARDIITVAGRDGRLLYVSGGVRNSLGYSVDERRSHSLFEFIHPDDVATARAKYDELVNGEIRMYTHQFRIRHKDGSYRWLECNYTSALSNPLVKGVVVNARDITERRQAEIQLAQREEVFRLAAEAVNGILFEWDLTLGIVHRSRGIREVLGLRAEELIDEGAWSALIHPQDALDYETTVNAALRGGVGWTKAYRVRDVQGRYRSMLERALVQRGDDGRPVRAIGCCVDVSEIQRLTDLLGEAQHAAKMGAWEYSYATHELTWTQEMFRIYETSAEEFAVSWDAMLSRFSVESRRRFHAAFDAAQSKDGNFEAELEITTVKGRPLWVRFIGHQEKVDGVPSRVCGSVQNVQAQKLAQIALENSTGWLKLSMNMAHMHAWRWNRATDTLDFAIVDGQMTHLPRVFPGMKKLMARVHPQDRLMARRAIDQAFVSRTEVREEFRIRSKNGQYRAYATVARPLFDAFNQPSGLVGVTQDVTTRHESEARMRRSEEVLRTTAANTADTLILLDTQLRVRFINRSLGDMALDDCIGCEVAMLLPEEAREFVVGKLLHVLVTAEAATYEFDFKVAGAETQYWENRAVLVRDDGIGTGISISMRNITQRKRLEREVLDVSTRERQTIGRDLHDGLGQELTGVALMLRGLATRLQRQYPESVPQVNEIVGLVNQSIETARSLARGLLPVNTETGGLAAALRTLAERSQALYGIEVQCRLEGMQEFAVEVSTANHLYRIAQEALTNTARHAQATAAELLLTVLRDKFFLEIRDNGKGLGEAGRSASGMGLKIMKYRASIIGARFKIANNQPHGTVVRVTGEQPMATGAVTPAHMN